MDDLIFVAVFFVMMTLTFGYVRVCEQIVRPTDRSGRDAE